MINSALWLLGRPQPAVDQGTFTNDQQQEMAAGATTTCC
jgi:hypothetical protein